ncbi:hypothetical protein SAMN05421824_0867 [Hyunsoonleella jejuensis]|uniref:Uncharacterized protein n=1 Tax=Hyunsoonleella jejuensis TaxID=419940 RepID=A0A1H9CCA6_9FLAO|nr:hypothetical protein SAMN05421824_0867 [Hyunsoonleella jejuensis]
MFENVKYLENSYKLSFQGFIDSTESYNKLINWISAEYVLFL